MSETVANDRVVAIRYTLRSESGEVLDSTEGSEPLSYLHGHDQIIRGLERALDGRDVGDEVQVTVGPDDAYGERLPDREVTVPRGEIDFPVSEGDMVQAQQPDGGAVALQVVDVDEERVVLDANHPLAGMSLSFDVEVVDVRDATPEELEHGHAHD